MKKILLFTVKILVSVTLLYFIMRKIEWRQFSISLKQGNILYLSFAFVLGTVFNLIKFTKWHYMIEAGNHVHSYWDGAKSYMIGNFLGMITPMRAGDIGRALYFPLHDRPRIIVLTIIDRLTDLAVVFILAIGGCFILINHTFGTLIVFLSILSLFVLYCPTTIRKFFIDIPPESFYRRKFNKILAIYDTMNLKSISVSLLFSLCAFLLIIIEFYFLVSAFDKITLQSISLVTPLITISTVIPVSIMGLGVREGLSILLLKRYGISAATALSAALLLFIINNVLISIIGVIYLTRVKLTDKKFDTHSSTVCSKPDNITS